MPDWLNDAVFYEIYPQTFYDSNGDGIGDIEGIIEKLYYVRELGCNALWINPCFDSPFKDAGYDVRDYKKVAPRYGTNEDMVRLFNEAREKGIRVLLDIVPGHTSEEHEWFKLSSLAEQNKYSGRYIWTDCWFKGIGGHPYIGGETDRNGTYMLNFFKCQPALNYGFKKKREPWQTEMHEPDALSTREALKDIMRFWLDLGCDGFRVDMADSLVKDDDDNKSGTCEIWQDIRRMLDADYPEAALVSEWSNPYQAINGAGFHMDFYLDHLHNGYNTLLRDYETGEGDNSYFKSDANGDINRFLKDYIPKYNASKDKGYISFMTCNHDTPRPRYTLSEDELKIAYAFIFTMPGVPFLYYGDEIGLDYVADIPTKEGGYTRTGSRTPMQWTGGLNAGFSNAAPSKLYLPIQTEEIVVKYLGFKYGNVGKSAEYSGGGYEHGHGKDIEQTKGDDLWKMISVESVKEDENSLYNAVKSIIALRHREEDLHAGAPFEVVCSDSGKAFVYRRGKLVILVNPKNKGVPLSKDALKLIQDMKPLYEIREGRLGTGENSEAVVSGENVSPQSFAVYAAV